MKRQHMIMDFCYVATMIFLFDQGYISFNDDGTIIISKALIEKDPHLEHFNFDTRLDPIYMTKNRRKFLKYHRENILKR